MPPTFTVRPATPADVPALCQLKWQFAVEEGSTAVVRASPDDWQRDMFGAQPRFCAIVADLGGALVGMVTISDKYCAGWVGPLCTIDDLFVVPAHRRGGIGKALLAGAAVHVSTRGSPFIELTVRPDNPALALYREVGFNLVPEALTMVLSGDALSTLVASTG